MSEYTQNLQVGTDHPVPVNPNGATVTLKVASGGGTVYYGNDYQVSASNNLGSISAGSSQQLTRSAWIIASAQSAVQVVYDDSNSIGFVAPFSYSGALVAVTGAGKFPVPLNGVITRVQAAVGTAPTGSSVIVDVKKNGTTIFTTSANRPTIAASGTTSTTTLPDVTVVSAGDLLSVDIAQVGSTVPGSDLTTVVYIHPTP